LKWISTLVNGVRLFCSGEEQKTGWTTIPNAHILRWACERRRRADYNNSRPHSQLGWRTPNEFAKTFRRLYNRPPGQIKPPERTSEWIKLEGKAGMVRAKSIKSSWIITEDSVF
jgi:hypothetical protein